MTDFISEVKWKKHTPYHYQTWFNYELLDYWPSSNKWMYKKQVRQGGLNEFLQLECDYDLENLARNCQLVQDEKVKDDLPLSWGKYKGRTPNEISKMNKGYILWLYEKKLCSKELADKCRN